MEMVDMQDLGSCAVRRVGSNPTTRTTSSRTAYRSRRLFSKVISHSFIPSLLLPKCDPLRWARIGSVKS